MLGLANVRIQGTQATDQHRRLRGGERQQLGFVHQQFCRRSLKPLAHVVAKAVGDGLQHGEGVHIGLRL